MVVFLWLCRYIKWYLCLSCHSLSTAGRGGGGRGSARGGGRGGNGVGVALGAGKGGRGRVPSVGGSRVVYEGSLDRQHDSEVDCSPEERLELEDECKQRRCLLRLSFSFLLLDSLSFVLDVFSINQTPDHVPLNCVFQESVDLNGICHVYT